MKNALTFVTLLVMFSQTAMADDWPFFRGPKYNGLSAEAGWSPWKGKPTIACTSTRC